MMNQSNGSAIAIAYWLSRLFPQTVDLANTTDCFFFHSSNVKGLTEAEVNELLIQSATWRYDYERQWRTLDRCFDIPLEPMLKGKTVLDFGCFVGGTTMAWMEQYGFAAAVGFDTERLFADGANTFARMKGANARFVAAFGESLPFEDQSVDAVISLDVFEHVYDPAACLRECYRVLRPGGFLLAVFPPFFGPISHHLKTTYTPFLHWIFGGETLRLAQNRRFEELGHEWSHFIMDKVPEYRVPTLNGLTARHFYRLLDEGGWTLIYDRRKGIPSFGIPARLPLLEEVFLDHVTAIAKK